MACSSLPKKHKITHDSQEEPSLLGKKCKITHAPLYERPRPAVKPSTRFVPQWRILWSKIFMERRYSVWLQGDLLSDEEKTWLKEALIEGLGFMQKYYSDVTKSLLETKQWTALANIQKSMERMRDILTAVPSRRSTTIDAMESICKSFRVHPLLRPCANKLSTWNCPPKHVRDVHNNFEEHWEEVKILLIAKENWGLLHVLSRVRKVLASTVESSQFSTEHDRSLVQGALRALQYSVTIDDRPSKLHGIVWQ